MRIRVKKKIALILAAVIIMGIVLMGLLFTVRADAKSTPRNGRTQDAQGNIYIYKHGKLQTGWFIYHKKRYYGHKTKSRLYPKGAVARNTYRVKNGKMYYFGDDGSKQTRSSKYITLNRHSTSVHYIHAPGHESRRYRYNANHKRYQYLTDSGKWKDTGMQIWPYGWIDWQE